MALGGLLLLVAGLCLGPVEETDLFFRMAAGEQFLRTGHLVHRNLFSFTYPDAPYLDSAWLFDAAAAALYRLGGFPAVVMGKTLVALAIATLAYRVARSLGAARLAAALVPALAFLCMRERLVERPHLFSLLGEVALLGLFSAIAKHERRQWLVLPLVVLWVNLHAGAFLAAVMLALGAVGALLDRQPAHIALRWLAFAVASLALLSLSPVGTDIFRYLTFHVGIFDLHPVDEFRSLTWRSDAPFIVFAAVSLVLLLLGARPRSTSSLRGSRNGTASLPSPQRGRGAGVRVRLFPSPSPLPEGEGESAFAAPPERLVSRLVTATLALFRHPPTRSQSWLVRAPALGLVALGVWHVRFAADAAIVLAVVAAPALEDLAGRFAVWRSRVAAIAFLAIAAAVTLAPRIAEAQRGGRFFTVDFDPRSQPVAALRFAEEHGLRDRMYNDFETGAYLLWQGYPRFRVFVDPRLPAYPVDFHRLLGRMDISRAEWTAAMDGLGVESALLDYAGINRRVAFWDPSAWALVFRSKDSRVFVRRLPKWKALIARLEIPASFDFAVESGATTLPLLAPPAESPVPACEWQIRLGDLYFDLEGKASARAVAAYRSALGAAVGCLDCEHELSAASWIGSLDASAGRFAEAVPLLERALALAPNDTAVLTNRALALDGVGRASEARETWARIATLARGTPLGRKAEEKSSGAR